MLSYSCRLAHVFQLKSLSKFTDMQAERMSEEKKSSTSQAHKNISFRMQHEERWQFLKQLPDRIIRDIGFVVASPPILLNSHELPTVCPDKLGGGIKNWLKAANWLASLNVDEVKHWFQGKHNNGRLGEHFAFCVEFVLLFAPFIPTRNLMTYKQVISREVISQSFSCDTTKEDNMTISIEVENDNIFIKQGIGKTSEILSESMNQTADSTADIAVPCSHLQGLTLERDVEAFESSKLGKIVVDDMHTETQHSIGERVGKRKKKQLRKLQRLKDGKGAVTTIGEFDFLFEETFKKDPETYAQSEAEMFGSSQTSGEIRINHWEASVKFLLYAGPWEMFGVKTPSHAAWHHLCAENENERHNSQGHVGFLCKETAVRLDECQLKEIKQCEDKFLGSFLGPHVGETLYNRKTRLINQLSLSQNIHAAALLCHHFGSCNPTESSLCTGDNCHLSKALLNTFDNYTSLINHKHHKVLRVFPRAILKGYLFYEHELWAQIYQKSRSGQGVNNYPETTNSSAQSNAGVNYDTSIINPGHWMGWWIQASNFPIFAMSTAHKQSKWYIVPKLEWLPPVVIDAADEIRTHQVLSLNEFMIVAEKIAKEAEQTKISRKQRFMVAEMAWETVNEMDPACDSKRFGSNLDGLSEEFGRWTEISRGFVVEDSWPDTRMYSPHGYKLFSVP